MSIVILNQTDVATLIKSIGVTGHTLQDNIHQAAVSCLDHAREFGDYRGALSLLNVLPRGQRVQALATWFRHFSNKKLTFKLDPKSKSWEGDISKDRTDADFNVAEAEAVSFAEFTVEVAPTTMTVKALIKKLSGIAINTESNKDGTPKVTEETRALAAKMLAVYLAKAA